MKKNMLRLKLLARFSFFTLIFPLFLSFGEGASFAQGNIRILHTQEHESRGEVPYLGRDLWFAIPLNAEANNNSTKYFQVYVTAYRNTTVNFQISGGAVVKRPVTAGQVTIFKSTTGDIPLSTELHSSGALENKAVHVWSDNADISVYFLSRVLASTDGMYVIPSTGWGKEYVVGGYSSLLIPANRGDYPSEFAVVANQNNTTITVIPSTDIRKDGFPNVIDHPKGIPFTQNLNRGECVQYQATGSPQDDSWDVTGTVITSNNPVGVMGGAVCPFIPTSDPYCDYVLDMLQPVRTWSGTYFSAPFAGRKYGGDAFLIVGSKNGQIITRNGGQAATLGSKYSSIYLYDITDPSLWTSDAPFMLVQYVESATHGAPTVASRNLGDPAEVVINPADQFSKKILFQTPQIDVASGQTSFTNYVNILLPANHLANTTYDGRPLGGGGLPNIALKQIIPIPNTTWEAIRLTYKSGQGEGTHVIASDTGVGVYIYGYGQDDSYAWAGALGTKSVNDPDTIPPVAIAEGPCFCAHIRIYDTGPGQSKLSSFIVDSSYNFTFNPDPNFQPGANQDSSYYDICVIDSSIEAYISVSIYDVAGNRTTVISKFAPLKVNFSPNPLNFGTVNVGNTKYLYDTICNTGSNPYNFRGANLVFSNGTKSDNLGFSIDSTGADGVLPAGGCRVIKVKVTTVFAPTVRDTMSLASECEKITCPVIVNGGLASFDLGDYTFDCTPLNSNRPSIKYVINNSSGIPIQIDSVWLDVNPNFNYDKITYKLANQPPFIVAANSTHEIIVTFNPQSIGFFTAKIHATATINSKIVQVDATISGLGCAPNITSKNGNNIVRCDAPANFQIPIENDGNFGDTIISVKGVSLAKGFSLVKVQDGTGNPIALPYALDSAGSKKNVIFAAVDFTPPGSNISGCFTDTIIVKTKILGDRATVFTVTICELDPQASATTVDLGPFPFGGAKGQNSFQVCDTGRDPLTITAIQPLSVAGTSSFALTNVFKVAGATKTLPITLAPKECMDVFVEFDPAKSNVSSQSDSFAVISDACNTGVQGMTLAEVQNGPSVIQGFASPPQFSCDPSTNFVRDSNENLVASTITKIQIKGATNFTTKSVAPITIPPKSSVKIPIDFVPTPQGGTTPYSAWVYLTIDNGSNTRIDSALITAIGQGMNLTVTSKFATPVSKVGSPIDLPIQISVDKHGLLTPLTDVDIRRIELTYNYNTDILDIYKGDIKNAVKISDSGFWSVDLATSKLSPGVLQLNLIGTAALKDIDIAQLYGTITFIPTLPKTGSSTLVTLTATNFYTSAATPTLITNCTQVAKIDSGFSLIYECGDTTLQKFMNGEKIMSANPVTPNPAGSASGRLLNFTYAARIEGVVSLTIYDELGKEVARVINAQHMPAGSFGVRYNSAGLAEGTYIYRFTLNNKYVTSGRVVIQK